MKEFLATTCTETVSGRIIDLANPRIEDIDIRDIAWALSRVNRYVGHTMTKRPYTVAQHVVQVSRYIEEALTPDTVLNGILFRFFDGRATALMEKSIETGIEVGEEFNKMAEYAQDVRNGMDEGHRLMISFHGLLHDFHEAYLTDVPTPVKRLPGVYEAYSAAEKNMDLVIFQALKLGYAVNHQGTRDLGCAVVKWADMFALKLEAYHMMPSRGLTWNLPMEMPPLEVAQAFRWPITAEQAYDELLARYEELRPADPIY